METVGLQNEVKQAMRDARTMIQDLLNHTIHDFGAVDAGSQDTAVAPCKHPSARESIPPTFPVRALLKRETPPGRTTCGSCGRAWDDNVVTGLTPAPAGRCPFEYFHAS